MTLYKIIKKETKEKSYAKDRSDIRRITKLSEASITKILNKLSKPDVIANTREFIIDVVEIDENSIKEVQE